ncbi:Pectinesterase PPME1 [Morella rubra]|uniref:Pectinesterase n=1 Tax=Morella rubra TaxID=262757 RepID=A0A6A1USD1_9ROSI|nr:Pectinesterase PPME1 [Morella rubra]
MALKLTHLVAPASFLATFLVLHVVPMVVCLENSTSLDSPELDAWIAQNMKEYEEASRRTVYDNSLLMALSSVKQQIISVRKDGRGNFKTVTDAVKSIPSGNTERVIIRIGGGEYREKVTIDRSRPLVTLYGEPSDMPVIMYAGTAKKYGTWNSATVAVESAYFMAVNIVFVNSAPRPDPKKSDEQAVALRISGDKAAFHNCKFIGFQDTLCDDAGRHLFRNCYIEGTVDFIFGNGKSVYLNTAIRSVAKSLGVITAQGEKSDKSGFIFIHCNITGSGDIYLGRALKETSRVVFAYTYMGPLINKIGWMRRSMQKNMYYGEYKCKGPGSSSTGRKYSKILSDAEVKPFLSTTFIQGNEWLLPVPKL